MAFNAIQQTAITDTTFNLNTASSHLSSVANTSNTTMNTALTELKADPNNPAKLANFQAAMNEWSVVMNLIATVQKAMKDSMSSIVQKM